MNIICLIMFIFKHTCIENISILKLILFNLHQPSMTTYISEEIDYNWLLKALSKLTGLKSTCPVFQLVGTFSILRKNTDCTK